MESLSQFGVPITPGAEYCLRVSGIRSESGDAIIGASVSRPGGGLIATDKGSFLGGSDGWNDPEPALAVSRGGGGGGGGMVGEVKDALELSFKAPGGAEDGGGGACDVRVFLSPAVIGQEVYIESVELVRL
jgi:hypothetical protein